MSVINLLLAKGYFPKELPPPFTTKKFADFVNSASFNVTNCMIAPDGGGHLTHPKKGRSRLCQHNLSRPDDTNRSLQIPHPAHFYYLCKVLDSEWREIVAHLQKSKLSISSPKTDPTSLRAYVPKQSGATRPKRRMLDRSEGDYLLVTDVSNFYGSVYSHSIPWALHTKAVAKINQRDSNLVGNLIDTFVRNGQDGQTLGIPIGPDTSFIIAELLLSSVDSELQSRHSKIKGFRFYDDYELICQDESSARLILSDLEDCVSEYELSLNRRKTRITKLPDFVEQPWVTELRIFELFAWAPDLEKKLIDFTNVIFSLSKKYPNDPVLRYALVKVAIGDVEEEEFDNRFTHGTNFPRAARDIYQQFLIQIYKAEAQVSHIVAGELLRYRQQVGDLDLKLIKNAISAQIMQCISRRANNEIAWAIWLAIQLKIKLPSEIANKVSTIDDNFVAILALHAQDKGLFRKKLDTSSWESLLRKDEIYTENWLLCYEAAARGWLPIKDSSNYINEHPCFGDLHRNEVLFYDVSSYENIDATLERLVINSDLYSI